MKSAAMSARIRITSADIASIMKRLNGRGITLLEIRQEDFLTVTVYVKISDYKETTALLRKWSVHYEVLDRQEASFKGSSVLRRMVLIIAIGILLSVAIYLPGKILFISVTGNEIVPVREILEVAEKKGVYFGANAVDVRSEKVKNELLEAIPELQWIGVNTSGCVATIQVQEKNDEKENTGTGYHVSSIVAVTDGIVENCTATRGTMLCKVGQAVKAGDVLISAYTDCGIVIQATQAEGEVYAETIRSVTTVLPRKYACKGRTIAEKTNYSLRIGKKLINFDNSSGIYHGSCAKIHTEQHLVLPGGFVLPVTVIKETLYYYESDSDYAEVADTSFLDSISKAYLLSQMVAGDIKYANVTLDQSDDSFILHGQYICSEMIGRPKQEEILQGEK